MLKVKHLKTSSYNLLVLSGVLWGLTPLIYKNALLYISVVGLIVFRFLGGAAIMYISNHKNFQKIKKNQKFMIFMFGLFSAVALLFYVFGLERTTALHASVISMTEPFWLYLIIGVFLKEKIHKAVILGSLMATVGLFIILFSSLASSQESASFIGDFMMLMSMLFTALCVATAKKILQSNKHIPSEQMVFYEYLIAGLIAAAVLIPYSGGAGYSLNVSAIFWMVVVVTIAGVVPLMLFYKSIRKLPGERISDGNFISPVVGFAAAAIFLGENITLSFVAGTAIIFIGLLISNNKFKPIHTAHYIISLERGFLRRTIDLEKEVFDKAVQFEKKAVSVARSSLL